MTPRRILTCGCTRLLPSRLLSHGFNREWLKAVQPMNTGSSPLVPANRRGHLQALWRAENKCTEMLRRRVEGTHEIPPHRALIPRNAFAATPSSFVRRGSRQSEQINRCSSEFYPAFDNAKTGTRPQEGILGFLCSGGTSPTNLGFGLSWPVSRERSRQKTPKCA